MPHYNLMSHIITELKNLSLSDASNSDYIIVTEVTNSLNQIETKTITLGEYTKYNMTQSNAFNVFRSGSHNGTFIGNFHGFSPSSSLSKTSSFSNTTNYLNYSANNGTSSYSINSNNSNNSLYSSYAITSSYVKNSDFSSTSSYVNVDIVTYKTNTSNFSNSSNTSSNSEKTNYLYFDGTDNGIVYHSINSDTCSYASIASHLNPKNTTTAYGSLTSSYSFFSTSASYALSSSYTQFSNKSLVSNSEAHAYLTLLINTSPKKLEESIRDGNISDVVSIKEYFNINKVAVTIGENNCIEIIVQYEVELEEENYAIVKAESSSRLQYASDAYTNNTDLFNYTSIMGNASHARDNVPYDITVGKSCSRSTAKITLIGKLYGATDDESNAEQREDYAGNVYNRSYISLLVLNGYNVNNGKNYPEIPPTIIPPKC